MRKGNFFKYTCCFM